MGSMYYILSCTVRNFLKNLIKKPLTLILYLLFIVMIVSNSLIVLVSTKGESGFQLSLEFYLFGSLFLILISIMPSLYQSVSNFALNLRMADVNFLMTSPIKPSRILLYAQIKTSILSVLISLFMMVQIPLMVGYFGLKPSSIPILIFAWFLMLLSSSPISLAVFVLLFKFPKAKPFFKVAFIIFCVALMIYAGVMVFGNPDPLLGLKEMVWSKGLSYFPLVGWYFEIFRSVASGIHWPFFMNVGLILLITSTSFLVIFKLVDTGFYEDAIKTSEKMETVRNAAKAGKSSLGVAFGLKQKKVKQVKYAFTKTGALAILQKQFLEVRKTGFYFFNFKTLLITLLDCLIAYVIPLEDEVGLSIKLLAALGVNMYILLLSSNISSITKELDKPFIYLIPTKNFKKLMALTSVSALKSFSDTLIPMMIISLYFKTSILDAILAALCMLVLSYTFNFLDLTASMIFGRMESAGIKAFLKIMLNMVIILPGIIIIAVLLELGHSITFGFVVLLLTTAGLGALLMLPATYSLKNPELNG